jgi:hypothetical protein
VHYELYFLLLLSSSACSEMLQKTLHQALAEERQRLFGHPFTGNDLRNAPLISPLHLVFISVPREVWSDQALKAKVEAGWSLEELLSFLHAQIHPFFVQAFQGHSEGDQSPKKDRMWPGTRTTGNPTEKKHEENFTGG